MSAEPGNTNTWILGFASYRVYGPGIHNHDGACDTVWQPILNLYENTTCFFAVVGRIIICICQISDKICSRIMPCLLWKYQRLNYPLCIRSVIPSPDAQAANDLFISRFNAECNYGVCKLTWFLGLSIWLNGWNLYTFQNGCWILEKSHGTSSFWAFYVIHFPIF